MTKSVIFAIESYSVYFSDLGQGNSILGLDCGFLARHLFSGALIGSQQWSVFLCGLVILLFCAFVSGEMRLFLGSELASSFLRYSC